ncbi:hypothetical protein D3C85_293170 [compost metagenome]
MNDLPLLPSERRQYEMKIREATNHADSQYAAALRHASFVVQTCKDIPQDIKDEIINKLWRE